MKESRLKKLMGILDNAPSHPSVDELNTVNENCNILFLPPNVTAIMQPLDQGLISLTKRYYKQKLLRRALFSHLSTQQYFKVLDLRDCFCLLKEAWDSLQSTTLHKVWKLLLGKLFVEKQNSVAINNNQLETLTNGEENSNFINEFGSKVSQVFLEPDMLIENSREILLKWLEEDSNDSG